MKKSTRSWKERICALLLAVAMVITWMIPNAALTAEAAPGDAGAVYFSVRDVENSNTLLTQDVTIKVLDNTSQVVDSVNTAETQETDPGHVNMFKVTGLDTNTEYTYTVEKTGYEYNAQNERKFTPTSSDTNIEVGMKMSEIALSQNSISLYVGGSASVNVANKVAEGTYTWSVTTGAQFVSVANGNITANAAGNAGDDTEKNAVVQVSNGRKTANINVTVSKNSFNMGLSVNPGEGNDQDKVELSATGIPGEATGTLTFKADGNQIGTAVLPDTTMTYNDAGSIIGDKTFAVEYTGDTKYTKQSASSSGKYTKTQELKIVGASSKEATYGEQEWNTPFTISLDAETIKGRAISAVAELADHGDIPNAVSAVDVADIKVNQDNTITVTPKNAGKIKIVITAEQGSTGYKTATAEYVLTVNRKTVDINDITWDKVSKVYDGKTGFVLTGTVNETNEKIEIGEQNANTDNEDVAVDSEKNPIAKDITITPGTYYAISKTDTGDATTANIQLKVEESANIVEEIATITHRPLYLKAGNTELIYGQNMKAAVEGMTDLITLLNENGTTDDPDSGLVENETAPVLPGATITGTDEKLYVSVVDEDFKVIVPALVDDNGVDHSISGNYEFKFNDEDAGILTVEKQTVNPADAMESIVISNTSEEGIHGINVGDSLAKVYVSINSSDKYDEDSTAPILKLAVKNNALTGLDEYYDRVLIKIGESDWVNATDDGINLETLTALVDSETDGQVIENVMIRLGRSDKEATVTEDISMENWLYADNKAPVAVIDGFHVTAYSKMMDAITFGMFRQDVFNADITVTDEGSGIPNADVRPQQYYVKELGSEITDEDLTSEGVKKMIEKIDQAQDPADGWEKLEFSAEGKAVIPVGAAESEEAVENNYLIFIQTVDNVGNCKVYVSNGIVIERQLPTIDCEFKEENHVFTTEDGTLGYSGDVAYELQITDPEEFFSGIDKIEVTVEQDGQPVVGSEEEITELVSDTIYENSYTFNAPDKASTEETGYTHAELSEDSVQEISGLIPADNITSNDVVLKVRATDRAGNKSELFTQKLYIDDGKPEIEVEFDKTNDETADQLPIPEYYQDSRTMTISYTDRNLGFNTTESAEDFNLADVSKDNIWFDFKLGNPNDGTAVSQYSLAELADLKDDAGNAMIEVKLVSDSQPGVTDAAGYKDGRTVTFELKFVGQSEYTITPHCADEMGFTEKGEEEYLVVDTEDPVITDVSYTCYDPNAQGEDQYVPFDPSNAKNTTICVTVTVKEHFFSLDGDFVPGQIGVTLNAKDLAKNDIHDATYYQQYYQNYVNDPENWSTTETDVWKISIYFTNDANYTFDFTYKDLASRADTMDQQTFTYDNTKPDAGEITVTTNDGTNTWSWIDKFLDTITFGFFDKFSNKNIPVTMSAHDVTSGVAKIEHYDPPVQAMTEEEVTNLPAEAWTPYDEKNGYEMSPDNQFVPYMKVTDYAGNVSYFSTESGFVADQTGPLINLECTNLNQARNGIFSQATGPVSFRVTAQDDETNTYSGIKEIWYEVHAEGNASGSIEKAVLFDAADAGEEAQRQNNTERVCDFTVPTSQAFNSNTVVVTAHAVDLSGNEVTDTETVSIDVTAPTIDVTYDLNSPLNDRYYNATRTATVTVTERNFDPSAVRFNITNTDGTQPSISGWSHSSNSGVSDSATHTCTVTFAADGDYTFTLNTTDLAGNDSNYTRVDDFTIDQTDPTIQVSYDNNNDAEPGYFNADRTATITVTEHNFNAAEVNTAITASLEGRGVATPGLGGWSTRGDVHTASVTFSADADYTFDVDYTDLAGNAAADYEQDSFTVDQTAPELEFFDIEDKSANNDVVAPGVRYSDNNYTENGVEITLEGANHGEMALDGDRSSIPNGESIKMADFERTKENDDLYTMTAVITDRAGNETEDSVIFSVNRFGSVFVLSDETQELVDNYYTNEEQDLVVTEINVDSLVFNGISYGRDGQLADLKAGTDYTVKASGSEVSWKQYDYTINKENFEKEGNYTVTIDSEDRATNVGNSRAKGCDIEFAIDKTAPTVVITGIENGEQYRANTRNITVNAADNIAMGDVGVYVGNDDQPAQSYDAKDIQAAGGELTYTMNSSNSRQDIRAVATDAAGNTAEAEITRVLLTSNLFVQFYSNTPLLVGTIVGVVVIAGGLLWFFLIFKKKKDEEQANK